MVMCAKEKNNREGGRRAYGVSVVRAAVWNLGRSHAVDFWAKPRGSEEAKLWVPGKSILGRGNRERECLEDWTRCPCKGLGTLSEWSCWRIMHSCSAGCQARVIQSSASSCVQSQLLSHFMSPFPNLWHEIKNSEMWELNELIFIEHLEQSLAHSECSSVNCSCDHFLSNIFMLVMTVYLDVCPLSHELFLVSSLSSLCPQCPTQGQRAWGPLNVILGMWNVDSVIVEGILSRVLIMWWFESLLILSFQLISMERYVKVSRYIYECAKLSFSSCFLAVHILRP